MKTRVLRAILVVFGLLCVAPASSRAQVRLEDIPGHERYLEAQRSMRSAARGGTISDIRWDDDGRGLHFVREGERYTFDLETLSLAADVGAGEGGGAESAEAGRSRPPRPARGRQRDREPSPDERWVAVCREYNIVLEDPGGAVVAQITTDGERKHRYGQASWVYGEELDQNTAMWWSPDSSRLAFYEFDERMVEDYHLVRGWTALRTEILREGYPKPGEPNPVARLRLYDVAAMETMDVDTGPSGDGDVGHYVYGVRFSPDGRHLLFFRTNRHQSVLELVAAEAETAACRVVVREEQETWQNNRPHFQFLEDGQRFLWETERSGYRHFELRNLAGEHLATLTRGQHPVEGIVHVEEKRGYLYYTAASGESPLETRLHRVGLDGQGDVCLSGEAADHHGFSISPDGRWFVATWETLTTPPTTALFDERGQRVALLAESEDGTLEAVGPAHAELFSFIADDATTRIYGVLFRPSSFDPRRRYPLLIDVYGGPQSRRVHNRFAPAEPLCELGFLVARIDNRGTVGRGKAFESANYLRLGTVDLQDQVDGVRHLARRPYVDAGRVGIFGHSYGGYMAALAILKHPDVFQVAVAASPVTDWKNYDTIYTERYMRTPQENPEGYEQGSCLTFARQLAGHLLIMHGMVDDNVHPTNVFQLIDALDEADERFDVFFYPERGHGLGRSASHRQIEYLYHHLIGKLEL
jgi:dipeptidyl-peptidase-4